MARKVSMLIFVCVVLVLSLYGVMDAQEPDGPGAGATPAVVTSSTAADVEPASVPLGAPGLSYRYVRTFGESTKAYLPDTQHINYPYGIGTDGTSLWVGELWGNRLLKYDSAGNPQTQLGQAGFPENYDDTSFWEIADVTVDNDGNIWAVDNSSRVVKLKPTGEKVLELGALWQSGADNSRFGSPISVAVDGQNNVYVSDGAPWWDRQGGNHRVQIFRSDGSYRTTIGQTGVCGAGTNQLCGPRHIAISGNQLYITDAGNDRVQIFNISTPDAPTYVATISNLNTPSGVAVDSTYIYIADTENNRVVILDRLSHMMVATLGTGWGTGNDQFSNPTDVVVDNSGNLYVADFVNTRVQQFARTGNSWGYIRTYGVTRIPYLTDGYHYNRPSGVSVGNEGSIHITEDNGHRLVKLSADGIPLWTVGATGVKGDWNRGNDRLNNPADVAVDASGRVYVASRYHGRVPIYNADGSYHATIYELNCPGGVSTDLNGRVYVADSCEQVVKIYDSNLSLIATLGIPGQSGSDNAHFASPEDVAVDSMGRIYISDRDNHRVQIFNADLSYVKTLGETGQWGSDFAHFAAPNGLFIDNADRLYVADMYIARIQIFDKDGNYLTTIGGNSGYTTGRLSDPGGVAVDSAGNVYIADQNNHRIQKFAPGVSGWLQMNINGFGDRWNVNVHALGVFQGHLYAGTYNTDSGAQVWKTSDGSIWLPANTPGFGTSSSIGLNTILSFKDQLYVGVRNDSKGGKIYRTADGVNWEMVVTSGFTDTNNIAVYELAEFNGQIYAGTGIFTRTHGAEIWRSSTGNADSWELVVPNGAGDLSNFIIRSSEVHNGYLYFTTENIDLSTETTKGGTIIRSSTGNPGSWSKVAVDGFGDADNFVISGLASYGGYLYASTARRSSSGIQVWRCQICATPEDWQLIVDNGFLNSDSSRISVLHVFGNQLYLIVGNLVTGAEVWRTQTGASGEWVQVGSSGFGDSNNEEPYYNSVVTFGDSLYVGIENGANGGEIWQLLRQVYLPTLQR